MVNQSSSTVWVAGDVEGKTVAIPLAPGESSADYMQDADAVVIDPGVASQVASSPSPKIEGEHEGAFKIGASSVEVQNSEDHMDLSLDRSVGYLGSSLLGHAGFISSEEARQNLWTIPKDRGAAEESKDELRRKMKRKDKALEEM